MTEPRTPIPLDVLGYIVDLLADGDDGDTKLLQTLSQTCKYVLPLCRKHLFSTLKLPSDLQSERFSDLLSRCPDLVRYVKTLIYVVPKSVTDHELKILDLLRNHSPILQSIELLSHQGFNWNKLPESMQSCLVLLIQLPTVTRLKIGSFKGFPSTALALCSNLIDLQLEERDIAPHDASRNITSSKIPTPTSLSVQKNSCDGLAVLVASANPRSVSPIIDFSRLQKASFNLYFAKDIVNIGSFIRTLKRIQSLSITITLPWRVGLDGIGQSLMVNAYRTLTFLAVNIKFADDDYNTLCGLNRELGFIVKNNILEEFKLDVTIHAEASCKTESEDWSALDSVLTDSGAFPMLHRVSITIWWYSFGVVDGVNEILGSLTRERFARLVESTAVLEFSFCFDYRRAINE